jgi:hypothetical protein
LKSLAREFSRRRLHLRLRRRIAPSSTSLKEFVMFKIRSTTRQLAAAVLASGCFVLALGARAEGGPHMNEMEESAACKSAKMSAWFDRQRQLTDGDFVPGRIATPRECAMTQDTNAANAANEAAPRKQFTATAKEPREIRRWDYEGMLGGQ